MSFSLSAPGLYKPRAGLLPPLLQAASWLCASWYCCCLAWYGLCPKPGLTGSTRSKPGGTGFPWFIWHMINSVCACWIMGTMPSPSINRSRLKALVATAKTASAFIVLANMTSVESGFVCWSSFAEENEERMKMKELIFELNKVKNNEQKPKSWNKTLTIEFHNHLIMQWALRLIQTLFISAINWLVLLLEYS